MRASIPSAITPSTTDTPFGVSAGRGRLRIRTPLLGSVSEVRT
jgi:hypothetical protein